MPSPAARRISWLIASLLKSKAIPEASLLILSAAGGLPSAAMTG
jgi:hypothetical protein